MMQQERRARPRTLGRRRSRLEVLTDHAMNAADALEALNRLRQGQNGAASKQLITALEREIRDALATATRRRRR